MKKPALLAALAGAILPATLLAAPAQAAYDAPNVFRHVADAGYDDPIIVRCADGRIERIAELTNSNRPGGCADVAAIYTRGITGSGVPTEAVLCRPDWSSGPPRKIATRVGWASIEWTYRYECVVSKDTAAA